jgi:hypothetical protein
MAGLQQQAPSDILEHKSYFVKAHTLRATIPLAGVKRPEPRELARDDQEGHDHREGQASEAHYPLCSPVPDTSRGKTDTIVVIGVKPGAAGSHTRTD